MFALLTFLWSVPFLYSRRGSLSVFVGIALWWILFGILIEFVQYYFASERSFDFFDMLADTFGCLLALAIILWNGEKIALWLVRRR